MALKTFNIDHDTYKKFSDHCRREGLSMSKKVENFIKQELEKRFKDPRIYLSLHCFDGYCPEIRNQIYNYRNLEKMLQVSVTR
ncbi:MAG: hypothetical protein ABIH92_03450, partial [Nanoarchaeota archaeon]